MMAMVCCFIRIVWGPPDSFFSEVLAFSSLILLASFVAVLSISSYEPFMPSACLSFSLGSFNIAIVCWLWPVFCSSSMFTGVMSSPVCSPKDY